MRWDQGRVFQASRKRNAGALARVPADKRTEEDARLLKDLAKEASINIVHMFYQQKNYEGNAKDYEFSGTSMKEHWQTGYEDTNRTLRHPEWLAKPKQQASVEIHDIHRDDDA